MIYFTLIGGGNLAISNKIEVIFRSSLASVFGFILSSNTKNTDKIKPKDGGLVDEKFCIKIIDCIIDFIDGTEDIIKIVNSSNDSRF